MSKTFTKDEVSTKVEEAGAKGEIKGTKVASKRAVDQLKDEIERTKSSDLGKAEKKAAVAALQNAIAKIKSPID